MLGFDLCGELQAIVSMQRDIQENHIGAVKLSQHLWSVTGFPKFYHWELGSQEPPHGLPQAGGLVCEKESQHVR